MSYDPNTPAPPAPATPAKKGKGCLVWTLIIVVGLVVVAAATGGSDDSKELGVDKAKLEAGADEIAAATEAMPEVVVTAPPVTEAPATTAPPTTAAPTTTTPAPPPVQVFESKGFTMESLTLQPDFEGDYEGVARITDNEGGRSAAFTITVFNGDEILGTLSGYASEMPAGQAQTIDFMSTDQFIGFSHYEFQVDSAF